MIWSSLDSTCSHVLCGDAGAGTPTLGTPGAWWTTAGSPSSGRRSTSSPSRPTPRPPPTLLRPAAGASRPGTSAARQGTPAPSRPLQQTVHGTRHQRSSSGSWPSDRAAGAYRQPAACIANAVFRARCCEQGEIFAGVDLIECSVLDTEELCISSCQWLWQLQLLA